MIEPSIQRISEKMQSVSRWLKHRSRRQAVKERAAGDDVFRSALKAKPQLKWWLIYGPPRSGTTYMLGLAKTCSRLYASDWGLAPVLNPIPDWLDLRSSPDFGYIRFDYQRFLEDISDNIIDNAYLGGGDQLDLVYKQATLGFDQYQALVRIWGPPERAIFCLREPAGYIASAVKKFIYDSVEHLQQLYISSVNSYLQIGGDGFEYSPELTVSDYVSFLDPLDFEGKQLKKFRYSGQRQEEHVTEEMKVAYQTIRERATS